MTFKTRIKKIEKQIKGNNCKNFVLPDEIIANWLFEQYKAMKEGKFIDECVKKILYNR